MRYIGMHIGLRYDIIGEYASLVLAILLLVFMMLTKPRQSKAFRFLTIGTLTSIAAILVQIFIVEISSNVKEYYDRQLFTMLLIVYLFLYAIILISFFNLSSFIISSLGGLTSFKTFVISSYSLK